MLQPIALGVPQQGLKPQTFAEALAGKDSITAVNQFCQRFTNRSISKEDIEYTSAKLPEGYQCTIKLDCLDGVEFAGEVCTNAKEAKLSAAQQVLEMYAAEIASMPATADKKKNNKKRPATGGLGGPDKVARIGEDIPLPNVSNKGELNQAYSKIIRRPTNKAEILFSTNAVQGGFQSQVQLPGLPPPWNNEVWAGEVHAKKGDAEQSVAGVALQMIRSDPGLMSAHNKPPKPNQWLMNGGLQRQREKGKGKGKGKDNDSGGFGAAASSQSMLGAAAGQDLWNQQYAAALVASQYPQYMQQGLGAGLLQ